jgi:simple sugar transport system permease protein
MIRLERRPEASQVMSYASPLIAIVLMLIGGLLLFAFLGKNPLEGFKVFFINPISDLYGVSELFLKATPLMLIAVGLAVGFRANVWNIGAEGQLIVGGIAASAVALYFHESEGAYVLILMVIAGGIGGMLWAAIPAFLKTRFNTNEILVSLMLVYVAQLLVSWLVHGPMMDPDGFNFPQSRMFEDSALLPLLSDENRLNFAFVMAIGALLVGYIFMYRSFAGFQMQVAGYARDDGWPCRYVRSRGPDGSAHRTRIE